MPTKDKLEFVFAMAKHSDASIWHCQRLMRYAKTYHGLQIDYANGVVDLSGESENPRDLAARRKELNIEAAICKLCAEFNAIPILGGDPRGSVVKIKVKDGYTNDFGGEGICVPSL